MQFPLQELLFIGFGDLKKLNVEWVMDHVSKFSRRFYENLWENCIFAHL